MTHFLHSGEVASQSRRVVATVMRLSALLRGYSDAYSQSPYRAAFFTCLFKGAIADCVAQIQIERRDTLDTRRTLLFSLWSAAYCGSCQHYIFNRTSTGMMPRPLHHWNVS